MATRNRAATQAADARAIAGIQKDLTNVSSLPLAGATYTMASLIQLVQSRIDAVNAVLAAKAKYAEAVGTMQALDTKVDPVMRGLRQYVVNAYGETAPQLADFGFAPTKRATQTPEQKATAVAKRAATRAARGTKGPKAKKAVTGETVKVAALQAQVDALAPPPAATAVTPSPVVPVAPTGAPPAATPPRA
jgi:hypothetical protein